MTGSPRYSIRLVRSLLSMNSEADQSSLTITNIPEVNPGNLDTFFICYAVLTLTNHQKMVEPSGIEPLTS